MEVGTRILGKCLTSQIWTKLTVTARNSRIKCLIISNRSSRPPRCIRQLKIIVATPQVVRIRIRRMGVVSINRKLYKQIREAIKTIIAIITSISRNKMSRLLLLLLRIQASIVLQIVRRSAVKIQGVK